MTRGATSVGGNVEADATEDQRALLEVSSRFIEDVCPLRAVRDGAWKDAAFAAAYRRQAAELGWFSMLVPESLGGGSVSGNGVLDAALIASRRGAVLQPGSFVGTTVVAAVIASAGSDRLKSDVLPALVAGDASASWAFDGAVDATLLDGGALELTGSKRAVQHVEGSSWLLVTATTPGGAAQALVAADAPGVTVVEMDSLDLTRR